MEEIQEQRIAHAEDKTAKLAAAEARALKLTEELYRALNSRNGLAADRMPQWALALQVQCLQTSSELSALVDVLERMGRIDRTEFTAQCLARLDRLIGQLVRPN